MTFEHFLCNSYTKFIRKTQYFMSYLGHILKILGHINPVYVYIYIFGIKNKWQNNFSII